METWSVDNYTSKERAKDKRLWKNYRWTLVMYRALERVQDYKCAGCGREARNAPLNLDHEHFRAEAHRVVGPYPDCKISRVARVTFRDGNWFEEVGDTKIDAVAKVNEVALPRSVRGLLCPGRHAGCNRLLGRVDKLPWLKKITAYLENPPARKVLPLVSSQ